ncbi:MAG: hypothetical protein LBB88_01090 [Planctomycetaceae bacterium]|nr:hypothetical protein [Planctomycetaceae bacterium]
MGENSSEFLPIAILGNRYAVLIKINSDLTSANADATFRRKVAYLINYRLQTDNYCVT